MKVIDFKKGKLSQTVLEPDEEMRNMPDEEPGIDLENKNVVNEALGIQ